MDIIYILNYISITSTALVLLILLLLLIIDTKLVNRVTIRLIVGICVADIINHVCQLLIRSSNDFVDSKYCINLLIAGLFGRLLYYFTNLSVCYHLHRSIVQLKKSSFGQELTVWLTIIILIAVIMTLIMLFGMYENISSLKFCAMGSHNSLYNKILYTMGGTICLVTIVTSFVVTYLCHRSLNLCVQIQLEQLETDGTYNRLGVLDCDYKEKQIKKVRRSFIYPLGTIVTLSVDMIFQYSWLFNDIPPINLFVARDAMNALNGTVTLICFSLDPAVWDSIFLAFSVYKLKFNKGK